MLLTVKWEEFKLYLIQEKDFGTKESNIDSNKSRFNKLAQYFNTRDFNRENFRAFIGEMDASGLTRAYQNKCISMAKNIDKYLGCDCIQDFKYRQEESLLPKEILTPSEIQSIANYHRSYKKFNKYLNDRGRAMYLLMGTTGCRPSEVLELRWADVKKGNFPTVTFRETKTGDSRTNVIGVEVFQAIQRLPRKNELVFNSVRSGTLRTNQINADLKKRAELLGITKPVWSYLFRISYITEMINAGVDWFLLSPIVGHKDPKTTKRYLQLSVNTQAEVITNHPLLKSQITHEQNLKVAKKFFRQAINTESSNLTVRDEGDALWIRIDKKPGQH